MGGNNDQIDQCRLCLGRRNIRSHAARAALEPRLLLYNLILVGFDCSKASVGSYDYDLSVIVRKTRAEFPVDLHFDEGDIDKLAAFFRCQSIRRSTAGRASQGESAPLKLSGGQSLCAA
jgi:hypothetical protein